MAITTLPRTGLEQFQGLLGKARGLIGDNISMIPLLGTADALNRVQQGVRGGDYKGAVSAVADVLPVGRVATGLIGAATKGKASGLLGDALNANKPLIPQPSTFSTPLVPTSQQMSDLSAVQKVPLSQARSFQEARRTGAKDERVGELVKGFADKPVAIRLNNGEYLIYDGNHRTDAAIRRGDKDLEMHVIDAAKYDPENAGKNPQPIKENDDELLSQLFGIQGGTANATDTTALNRYETEFDRKMALAQQRAALPVSKGGLGLPPDNTPMDRARAMGGVEGIHFSRTGADVNELDSGKYAVSPFDAIGTHIGSKDAAMQRFENTARYADSPKGVTYPVVMLGDRELISKKGRPMTELEFIDDLISRGAWNDKKDYKTQNAELRQKYFSEYDRIPYINDVEDAGNVSYIVPPQNIRSRFAAFDPFRRNEADLLAFNGTMGGSGLLNINPLLGLLGNQE